MYCQNCGTQVAEDTLFCPVCGTQVAESAPIDRQNPDPQAPYNYMSPQNQAAESAATTSMVCGIVGFFIAGVVLGIIAIIQSRKAQKLGYVGGKATAGLVLGIIDIIKGGFVTVIVVLFLILAFSKVSTPYWG
ncbi:MAG: zinc-ribbon domain-containing protein [Firmicutes bacterium]|nr:zinc-ribbon domain-containing protein [Bacillota bacterium]